LVPAPVVKPLPPRRAAARREGSARGLQRRCPRATAPRRRRLEHHVRERAAARESGSGRAHVVDETMRLRDLVSGRRQGYNHVRRPREPPSAARARRSRRGGARENARGANVRSHGRAGMSNAAARREGVRSTLVVAKETRSAALCDGVAHTRRRTLACAAVTSDGYVPTAKSRCRACRRGSESGVRAGPCPCGGSSSAPALRHARGEAPACGRSARASSTRTGSYELA